MKSHIIFSLLIFNLKRVINLKLGGKSNSTFDASVRCKEFFRSQSRLKSRNMNSRVSYHQHGSIPSVLPPVASRSNDRIFSSIIPVEYFLVIEREAA